MSDVLRGVVVSAPSRHKRPFVSALDRSPFGQLGGTLEIRDPKAPVLMRGDRVVATGSWRFRLWSAPTGSSSVEEWFEATRIENAAD